MGFFGRLASTVLTHPRATAALMGFLVLSSLLFAKMRLGIDPNIIALLPPEDPVTQALAKLDAEEQGVNLLTVAVDGPDEAVRDAYMRGLAAELQALPTVRHAVYDIDEDLAWNVALLQIEVNELTLIRDRLQAALALGAGATNPFIAGRLLDLGPLTERLKEPEQSTITATDGVARVVVQPTGSANDTRFARLLMDDVDAVLADNPPEAQGLQLVWLGGPYRHNVEDLRGITYDLKWTAVASLTLVFVLITVTFRDPRAIAVMFVPLLVGNALTLGFATIAVGSLNTFTSYFLAIIIGLGIDFSIHLYARYREERAGGLSLEDAVILAWDRAGPPCFTAAITSAGAFAALWIAGFRAFRQLGSLLAGGVLICLFAVLVTLPLLILWRERQSSGAPLRLLDAPVADRPPSYRLAPLGITLAALFTISMGFLVPKLQFQYDTSELRREGLAYSDLDETERKMVQDSYTPVVVQYETAAELAAGHQRLEEARKNEALPEISRVLSIHSVLPVDQSDRLSVLREIAGLSQEENVRYLPAQVQKNLDRIGSSPLEVMTRDQLPEGMQAILGGEGRHWLLMFPAGNMWDLREATALYDTMQVWLPGEDVAGVQLALSVMYRLVKDDAPKVLGLAFVAVFVFSLLDLRSLFRALGTVAALIAGMCWAGAALVLFQVEISISNFAGIPILMGIGVDVIIHLLHRMYEEGPGRILHAMSTTGFAAALSASTTVLSFGALSVASSKGIQSLGLVVLVGLTMVTVAAFVLVPLGWMTTWKIKGEAGRRAA